MNGGFSRVEAKSERTTNTANDDIIKQRLHRRWLVPPLSFQRYHKKNGTNKFQNQMSSGGTKKGPLLFWGVARSSLLKAISYELVFASAYVHIQLYDLLTN